MTETVLVELKDRVGILTLNRPDVLNALSFELLGDLTEKVKSLSLNPGIGCIVISGSGKAFAAGADIKQMSVQTYEDMTRHDRFGSYNDIANARLPVVAAVSGFAFGGGCELAMMCDIVIAGESAKFGQPEIKLGVIPGMGGTQRLVRAIGKAKAMDLILTGRPMNAREAELAGLVSRVVPDADVLETALGTAQQIAGYSRAATVAAKEATNRAFEVSLAEGLLLERRVFHPLFASENQKEGMAAFLEKRAPKVQHS